MKVVTYYKYLGLMFSSRLNWSEACKNLALQASKAVIPILHLLRKNKFITFSTACSIFYCKISPILLYGSEIWGVKYFDVIEKVHLTYLKSYLGIGKFASNKAVLGESGRYSLFVSSQVRVIKYWFKLLKMDTFRYPYQCYQMLKRLDDNGKQSWSSDVDTFFLHVGFPTFGLNKVWEMKPCFCHCLNKD